jgi:excisionase family DNA binding protein
VSKALLKSQLGLLLTIHQAAAQLGCSYSTLYRLIRSGAVPAYRIGGWRVSLEEVKAATLNTKERECQSTSATTSGGSMSPSVEKELDDLLTLMFAEQPSNCMTN